LHRNGIIARPKLADRVLDVTVAVTDERSRLKYLTHFVFYVA